MIMSTRHCFNVKGIFQTWDLRKSGILDVSFLKNKKSLKVLRKEITNTLRDIINEVINK